jgi:hypothetical protein
MSATLSIKRIAWKRVLFFMLLIFVPNLLIMQGGIAGPVNDILGLGTAIDLVLVLPLVIFFFGFRKRGSFFILFAFMLGGLLLANWIIPSEADTYLTYFNYPIIAVEASIITFELFLFVTVLRKLPSFMKNFKREQKKHFHFLLSFSQAILHTFSFEKNRLHKLQFILRVLATDIAAIYYSLLSWKKKAPILNKTHAHTFTFHKNGAYLGVFFMIVHAMLIEIVAVHLLVAQFSHTIAWIVTMLDIYALLFIIADYQAIRLSPVIVDREGLHFQKGIRLYGFISFQDILEISENTKDIKETEKDQKGISLALHGLEKEETPYVIKLNKPVEVYTYFGKRKNIESIYIKMDEGKQFVEYLSERI